MTSKDLFYAFLKSVCSDICGLVETDERKFFILCAFITNVTTLSFTLPCYRLIPDIKSVLVFHLKTKFSLNFDSDVKVAFESLEGKCLQLTTDRQWIRSRLQQLRKFIPKAANTSCSGVQMQRDVAFQLKLVNYIKIHKSTNAAESIEDERCPFCKSNCKAFLDDFLNY
ncbi:hypothetical protein AVEN_242240-1 [Araneus ventricosus]|nr:hypothetical protein AVEN_242240-1 [Araneus ventricosus]